MRSRIINFEEALAKRGVVLQLAASDTAANGANEKYIKAVTEIYMHTLSVNTSTFPELNHKNAHTKKFAEHLNKAQKSAQKWNQIDVRLKGLPEEIVDFCGDDFLKGLFAQGAKNAGELIIDPTSKISKDILLRDIKKSHEIISGMTTSIKSMIKHLKDYNKELETQAQLLLKITNDIKGAKDVNNEQIKEIKKLIDQLKSDITNASIAITALAAVNVGAIVMSGIAIVVAGPFGAVAWLFTGAVIAGASYVIAMNAYKIQTAQEDIKNKTAKMGTHEADILVLDNISEDYNNLSNKAREMTAYLESILSPWSHMEQQVGNLAKDIDKAGTHFKASDWKLVKEDFEEAEKIRKVLEADANSLILPQFLSSNAKIEIGMSEAEVKKAVANSKTVPFNQILTAV